MNDSQTPILPVGILQPLLHDAGLIHPPQALTLLGVSTCAVWTFMSGGQQYVVRVRQDGDTAMLQKEVFLSDLLHRHAIPAPVILAAIANDDGVALLQTWLPGLPLDQALPQLGSADLLRVWHSVGELLSRVHSIVQPVAGEIIADRVEPFSGGWSTWLLNEVTDDIRWLESTLGGARSNLERLERVVAGAKRCLDNVPIRLIHNDALPQNILVAPGSVGWCCVGMLDWEFARAGDPYWDLGTLDFRPARQVPASFYAGYGSQPAEPQRSIYELLMATWRTRAELEHGSRWSWPPREARIAYLRRLPEHIDRIAVGLGLNL